MLLMERHLLALEACDASGATSIADQNMTMTPEAWSTVYILELQGLLESQPGGHYALTPYGREAAHLIAQSREHALLPAANTLAPNWRFLGSEVLAALAAAARAGGAIGPVTQELLRTRGLAEEAKGGGRAGSSLRLNALGMQWLELARACQPHVRITQELAATIRHLPPSYSPLHAFTPQPEQLWELEAMDLLVWSVPEADVYLLTALGEAVFEAIEKGAYPQESSVLDDGIMRLLAAHAHATHGPTALTAHDYEELQRLGYLDAEGALTVAGEAALRALRILELGHGPATHPASFAIASEEIALLREMQLLAASTTEPARAITRTALHMALLDRPEKHYQEFVGEYGRTIEDVTARKHEAHDMQAHLREQERSFGHPGEIDGLLMRLEAWDLVCTVAQNTHTVYRVTARGQQVLEELQRFAASEQPEEVSSTAVKAITCAATATRFGAPATTWVQQAHAEGLIGSQGITRVGRYVAGLAKTCPRLPILTRAEAEVLVHLPEDEPAGATSAETERSAGAHVPQAIDRLEARGLIDRLVDGHIVRTEAGVTLTRAVQGALELAYPVTPALLRLLLAIQEVKQSLYAKDGKGYLSSETWEEVERLSGLNADTFREMVHLARLGQYLGDANLTEAGEDLLAVMALQRTAWPAA